MNDNPSLQKNTSTIEAHSQLGQDEWALEMLEKKRKGVFLEVGASNGVYLSNTFLLEKGYDWTGLCIEPSSEFENLKKNRNCQVANDLIFNKDGVAVEFIEDQLNDDTKSFSGIQETLDKHTVEGQTSIRITKTLTTLLKQINFPKHIDFLSIDTEGSEYEILQGIDFEQYQFSLIVVEHNWVEPKRTKVRNFLFEKGYQLDVFVDSQFDDWFIHNSLLSNAKNVYFNKAAAFRRGIINKIQKINLLDNQEQVIQQLKQDLEVKEAFVQNQARKAAELTSIINEKEKVLKNLHQKKEELEKKSQILISKEEELFKKENVIQELVRVNQELLQNKEAIINSMSWKVLSVLRVVPYFIMVRLRNISRLFTKKTKAVNIEKSTPQQIAAVKEVTTKNEETLDHTPVVSTRLNTATPVLPEIQIDKTKIDYKKGLAALAIPCVLKEKEAIIRNFHLWDNENLSPYSNTVEEATKIPIIIIANRAFSQAFETGISTAFYATKTLSKQFKCLEFYYCNLNGDDDTYEVDYSKKVGSKGYKSGPNNQFFMSMNVLSHYGDYIFYMETDCFPVQKNWLGALSNDIQQNADFWIKGSLYRGLSDMDEKFKTHLNGNAIYAVGNPDFMDFLLNTIRPFLMETIRAELPWLAYDCATAYYFYQAVSYKDKAKWKNLQNYYHLFKSTDYIQNHSGFVEAEQNLGIKLKDIIEGNPNTYVVHGRHLRQEVITNLLR